MGLFIEKSVIIEFNGLPATGKTTIANALVSMLQKEGIPCARDYIKYKWQKNGRTAFLSPKLFQLFVLLKRFADSIKPRRYRFTHIMGEMYHCRSYWDFLLSKTGGGILVIDQGLIQSIVSIADLDKIEDYASLRKVVEFYKKKKILFISVDCIINPMLSFERIKDRPDNAARMHKIPREQLLEAMEKQALNIEVVRKCFIDVLPIKTITIDTECNPTENALIIYNKLLKDGYISE